MKLSVIIPVYNREHLIAETLRSLLAQTRAADEIIVVDDGSTDDTAAVAERIGGLNVRVIRQENQGPAAARNAGFAASSGEFIHFFDSDDLAASNKHEIQLAALENSGADIAYSPWVKGHFGAAKFSAQNLVLQQHGLPKGNLLKALLANWSIVPHACLFRRSIVEKVGGFPMDLFGTEDQMMFLSCLLAGAEVVHTPETIEFYRLGEQGKITENSEWHILRFQEWGRFLVRAREACLEKGIEPLKWFGYRRRLWEALQDLKQVQTHDRMLVKQLLLISPQGLDSVICHCHRQMEHWQGGLQQRLTGGRAHRSFCTGPVTSGQMSLLGRLGYSWESPHRLPWLP